MQFILGYTICAAIVILATAFFNHSLDATKWNSMDIAIDVGILVTLATLFASIRATNWAMEKDE